MLPFQLQKLKNIKRGEKRTICEVKHNKQYILTYTPEKKDTVTTIVYKKDGTIRR